MKVFVLRLPGVTLPLWVTVEPSSPVVRQVAPSKTDLQSRTLHTHSVLREELLACGSAMRMCHLSVTLSVQFADADTDQKAQYRPDTDNRSDNRCITKEDVKKTTTKMLYTINRSKHCVCTIYIFDDYNNHYVVITCVFQSLQTCCTVQLLHRTWTPQQSPNQWHTQVH